MSHYLETLVTLGFLGALMWAMMKFMLRDIHNDLVDLKKDFLELKENQKKVDIRIDHLYQICINILESKNKN